MNRRRKRMTTGEKVARGMYYGFMTMIVIIVCLGMIVAVRGGLEDKTRSTVSVYGCTETPTITPSASLTPTIIPTIIATPSPTSTPLPTPTNTPKPTPTPTPEPENFWGCDHRCDEEGRYYDIELDPDYQVYIHELCEKIGVPFDLAIATCWKESLYRTSDSNINDDGTIDAGLFQINECNWEWMREIFGESWDPYDPYDSIDAGLFYIQYCMQFDDDPRVFMMAYNMGPTGARKHWNKGTWSSKYSRAIYEYMTEELPTLKIIKD